MNNTVEKRLGEIALRVDNLDDMSDFYENVVGLKLMQRWEESVFFKIAEGFKGHTQILALFDRSAREGYRGIEQDRTSLDHLAFSIALEDYEKEKQRLEEMGVKVSAVVHEWVQWRSLYIRDPEGNLVELVCFDDSIVRSS